MKRRSLLLLSALALVLTAGCTTPPPAAELPWQAVHRGVERALVTPLPASRVHVLRIDLHTPGLRIAVSPREDRGRSVDTMASTRGALASINASFFDSRFNPLGITASGGRRWDEVMRPSATALFGCDERPRCGFSWTEPARDSPAWRDVVGGQPWLVREGRARSAADDAGCQALCARAHPRTAVALDASGRWLFLVLAEGRRPNLPGLTLAELSAWLATIGVHDALNLDGGGSSTLLIRGESVMARPANEPELRRVANALHVFVDGAAPD